MRRSSRMRSSSLLPRCSAPDKRDWRQAIYKTASDVDTRREYVIVDLQRAYLSLLETIEPQHITVNRLIGEAGVSRATFYRHFRSLTDVLQGIIDRPIERLVDLVLGRFALADPPSSSGAIIEMIMENPKLWQILLTTHVKSVVQKEMAARALSRSRDIAEYLQPELPSDHCAAWSVNGTFEILSWWLSQSDAPPEAAIVSLLDRLTLRPALREIYEA